jgi:hypothetical protein
VSLKRLARAEAELKSTLERLLRPPAERRQGWRQQEAPWKRRAAQDAERRETNKREWKDYLDANVETLRDRGKPDTIRQVACARDRLKNGAASAATQSGLCVAAASLTAFDSWGRGGRVKTSLRCAPALRGEAGAPTMGASAADLRVGSAFLVRPPTGRRQQPSAPGGG